MSIIRSMFLSMVLMVLIFCVTLPATGSDLFVADFENHRVLRFNGQTGAFTGVFIPNVTIPSIDHPLDIVAGPTGDLFITSGNNPSILRVNPGTGALISGLQPVGCAAQPRYPRFGPDGFLYVGCLSNGGADSKIVKLDPNASGESATIGDFVAPGSGGLREADGLAFGSDGRLYVANGFGVESILRYDGTTGAFVDSFVPNVGAPRAIEFRSDGALYVLSLFGFVNRYSAADGSFLSVFVPSGSGGLAAPRDFAFGPDGHLYISSYGTGEILRYDGNTGAFLGQFTSPSAVTPQPAPIGIHFVSGVVQVQIDIKPGDATNSINLGSSGVVPVAIQSSATFDATTVDPETVTLAGAKVRMVGKSGRLLCHTEDVNGDSLLDLLCQVETAQFLIQVGDSLAVLEAETLGGQAIRGEDAIRIVP